MKSIFERIQYNPFLAFILLILLNLTKYIIQNPIYGVVIEITGLFIFIVSVINWIIKKVSNKSKR